MVKGAPLPAAPRLLYTLSIAYKSIPPYSPGDVYLVRFFQYVLGRWALGLGTRVIPTKTLLLDTKLSVD